MARGGSSSHGSSHGGGGSGRTSYNSNNGSRGGYSYSRNSGNYRPSSNNRASSIGHRPPPPPPHHYPYYHNGYHFGHRYYSTRPRTSFFTTIVAGIIVLIMLLVVFFFNTQNTYQSSIITNSTLERSKLSSSYCEQIPQWFEDNMSPGWISNENTLIQGMKYFYNKTGVQPYLILVNNLNGNKYPTDTQFTNYLSNIYDDIMPDGGHIVVGFLEGNPNDYAIACYAGKNAESVMDEEAREILLDYLEHYYTSNMDDEEYFATVFRDTADKIMKIDTVKSVVWGNVLIWVLIIGGIIIIGIIIIKRNKFKVEQAKADAEILNTNLANDINSSDTLKDKYQIE